MEEHHLLDEYLEDLNAPVSQSTMDSEENLDEAHSIRKANDNLKKELAKVTEEYHFEKKLVDQQDKDSEIQALRGALERVTEERDILQKSIEKITTVKVVHKPVDNPLQMMLINQLKLRGAIKSRKIEEVMRSIDRGDFAPKDPYVDRPQPIGFNTTISAPHMHATQLEILKECFKKSKKAIDIGTGSGYIALCLAKMMRGYKGKVYALDHIPKMIEQARENIAKFFIIVILSFYSNRNHAEYIEDGRIEFVVADGRECLPEHAPFDIIFVGGAVKEIPECFINQLSCGGSMIIPVGHFFQDLVVVHKTTCGRIEVNSVMPVMFGKLQSVEKQCPDIDD